MTKRIQIDQRRTLLVLETKEQAIEHAAKQFVQQAKDAIDDHGHFFVALSGGSTPKALYKELSQQHQEAIDWGSVHFFFSDERCVAPTHEDSNYHMAMTSGLKNLPINPDMVHKMYEGENPELEAKEYETLITRILGEKRQFDLIMLGMGDDGHTASLFPHTKALDEQRRNVVANFIPQKDTWRITMTYPLLAKAKHTVFYVMGENKQTRLKEVLSSESKAPAFFVGSKAHPAIWITDQAAAKLIDTA